MRWKRRKPRRRIDWPEFWEDVIDVLTFAWVFTLLDDLTD
ncbi:hypothetical protein PBI_MRMAGOO_96 [Mycobacterium phage MrMagoo]|uniref:Uncharacterized protein n=1 Tax=Mycobacterium phage MrMagoo TaxID=1927020 RepID=A0A1L6BYN2_9CAUD|nr:hypothetical protein J4U04_gp096 [Mycobacterium phage MrMagoo]APQ42199.1 hypothetical protein PBI_MRMAGOO_96 [Mycobacterium phage MrMagoo]ARM70273.1 hypothetical protein SEA_GARDENSALSA_95 [Mycobacterium phage GardenSalsa]